MARNPSILSSTMRIVAVGVCGILITAGGFAALRATERGIAEREEQAARVEAELREFNSIFLQARRSEKDFLLRRDEKYVARHADVMTGLLAQLDLLREVDSKELQTNAGPIFAELAKAVDTYGATFGQLAEATAALGFDETQGREGELRGAVHNIEEILKGIDSPEMMVKMLMMRRHEKDFIMRRNEKYIGRLENRVAEFQAFPTSMFPSPAVEAEVEALLLAYQQSFRALAEMTMREAKLREAVSASYAASEPHVAALTELIQADAADTKATAAALERRALFVAAGGLTFLLILFFAVAYQLARSVARPLQGLKAVVGKLAAGNLDVETPSSRIVEIRDIAQSLNVFRDTARERAELERTAAKRAAEDADRQAAEIAREDEERARKSREADERQAANEATRAAEKKAAAEIADVVAACARGDFSRRLRTDDKEGVFAEICLGINEIGRVAEEGLSGVISVLDQLARGDLSGHMSDGYEGMFAEISTSLNVTAVSLIEIVGNIANGSASIDAKSEAVAEAMGDMSRRTERSAASFEETAAALEQLSASVKSTAEGAGKMRESVHAAKDEAQSSVKVAGATVEAMKGIEESSLQISKIIGVIDDIAFQTNLLALNAGVEAARAGDAGRGFAVVASEVRALAQRSSEAANEINSLIARSKGDVATGVESVSKSQEALDRILSAVETVARQVTGIADATVEQSTGITEISSAVSEMDRSTQRNAALFEEITSAAETMRVEAQKLSEAVSRFDVPEGMSILEQSGSVNRWNNPRWRRSGGRLGACGTS